MYRLVGTGAADGCTIPAECIQAVKMYPERLNTSLVDDYCAWQAKGMGGQVEKICLEALMLGEQAKKEQAQAGTAPCATNDDCESGVCDQGVCALAYPANKFSEDTLHGQMAANAFRAKAGLPPIEENGILTADTCNAWATLCEQEYAKALIENPLAMRPDYIVDRKTWNAMPCFASGCMETEGRRATMWGLGLGILGIAGAWMIYNRGRSTR